MSDEESRLLLLVDRDTAQARLVGSIAARAGWRTQSVPDGITALAYLASDEMVQPDALLLDGLVAREDSCKLIGDLRGAAPQVPILFLTQSASPLLAVEAMRAGATDYLMKPIGSERLLYALESSVVSDVRRDELAPLAEKIEAPLDFDMMIGSAPEFRSALARAAKAARGHGPILVAGEPGTGKELLARAMRSASPRAKSAFLVLHTAGMSAGNLESALYGHEKGAFPGAFERRTGILQEADGGTLLIDDIERLPLSLQARLAHTIATGEAKPMGANHSFRLDVRILATSSEDPVMMASHGVLDPTLGEALAACTIGLPPLRERHGDVPSLARHFLALIGEQPGLRRLGVTDEALCLLESYQWPGNLRQLQAVLFRAAIFCDRDALTVQDFPQLNDLVGETIAAPTPPQAGGVTLFGPDGHLRTLEEIEADVIRLAIGHYRGRMSEVARRLGIGRSTLYRKLGDLGIDNAA
ncbi:sigma-54-dependent transcriptional regulator [Croceicoccus naphthovorans]|uniref:DNA-binding transcriptional regulator NtrC n=1 Tax=Croceicoccus naphthovorans TaxID=1348774 RepID=A0A0G3XM41_9SPHN|nr:sigma-54 dependent transcriptional regulator [Croceicoccus naphthovorans]AKM11714.1 Fis family transcriptional regulator [Croceicoccus naphthovorans]MBB3990586.1 DNA-binding NtrC family response regulator [Croceicoccus naphthovorans]